jgi:hypothetical protein
MNSLYIFVDAERPDQYLNSLVYCVLKRDVRRVTFAHIKGLIPSTESSDGLSGRVMGKVQAQLAALSEDGEYLITSGERSGQRLDLRKECGEEKAAQTRAYYSRCRDLSVSYSNEEIEYAQLREYLRRIARQSATTFVDVTAIRKRYLGDLVAGGLVEGLGGLHTFDIILPADFDRPWLMLIHELEPGGSKAFAYTNLLDTQVYKSCKRSVVVRTPGYWMALTATLILITAAVVAFTQLGPSSNATQGFFYVSSVASILSLAFMFLVPRSR